MADNRVGTQGVNDGVSGDWGEDAACRPGSEFSDSDSKRTWAGKFFDIFDRSKDMIKMPNKAVLPKVDFFAGG